MKNKKLLIAFIIVLAFHFMRFSISLYKDIHEEFSSINIKESMIAELEKNPNKFMEYGITSKDDLTEEKINEIRSLSIKYQVVFTFGMAFLFSLLFTILLFIPVFIFLSIRKKYRKYRISSDTFKAKNEYYRDLLKGYTPLELSYIDNYQIDDYALMATVLNMENKKILKFHEGKFFVNRDIKDLTNIEKKIICGIGEEGKDCIEASKLAIYSDIINSCKEKDLIELGKISKKKFFIDLIVSIIIYGIVLYFFTKYETTLSYVPQDNGIISIIYPIAYVIIYLIIYFYPTYFVIKYIILFIITTREHYKKTALGNEINGNLEGLKNFIRDFSVMDEREKKEVVMWDEYLVYSVMFGDNKNIIEEYQKKVKYNL